MGETQQTKGKIWAVSNLIRMVAVVHTPHFFPRLFRAIEKTQRGCHVKKTVIESDRVIPETKVLFLGEIEQFGGNSGHQQYKSSQKMCEEQRQNEKGPAMTPVAPLQNSGRALSSAGEAPCCQTFSFPCASSRLRFFSSCLWWDSRWIFSKPLFISNK